MSDSLSHPTRADLEGECARLRREVNFLWTQFTTQGERLTRLEDKHQRSNIVSPDFWTRAFAVVGHALAGGFGLWILLAVFVLLLELL